MTGIRPKGRALAKVSATSVPQGQPINSPAFQRRELVPLRLKSRRDGRIYLTSDDQLTQNRSINPYPHQTKSNLCNRIQPLLLGFGLMDILFSIPPGHYPPPQGFANLCQPTPAPPRGGIPILYLPSSPPIGGPGASRSPGFTRSKTD